MEPKTVNHIIQTMDYSLFKPMNGNRNVNKVHVNRLIKSFRKSYLISPIIVNKYYQIIDGQHRFEAAKTIGLPLYYFIVPEYGLQEVQTLNENMKNWNKSDYLNAYCDLGNPEYLQFRNFTRRFPEFSVSSCEVLLTEKLTNNEASSSKMFITDTNKDGSYALRCFQEGDLKIQDYNRAVKNAEKIMQIKQYYDGFNRTVFVRAMLGLLKLDYYDHSKMIEKLKANPGRLQHCSNVTQYKLLLEDIYNFRSKEKVSLRF